MLIPFLFEIRTIIDWFFVKSSLRFSEWVKVEAIYAKVYTIKCDRLAESHDEGGQLRGESISWKKKVAFALVIFIFLMIPLWFPLLFFAYKEAIGQSQTILSAHVTIQFGSHEPFYQSSSVEANIHQFTEEDLRRFRHAFNKHPTALTFLDQFDHTDVVAVSFNKFSSKVWDLPPPTLDKIKDDMKKHKSRFIHYNLQVIRAGVGAVGKDIINEFIALSMEDKLKDAIASMLADTSDDVTNVVIPTIYKKFNVIRNLGKFGDAPELMLGKNGENAILILMNRQMYKKILFHSSHGFQNHAEER